MKLHVTQTEWYSFNIPPEEEAAVRADPDDFFTTRHNAVAEADGYEVKERSYEIETDAGIPIRTVACPNCAWRGPETSLQTRFPNIPDLLVRIAPGEPVPYGECPRCAALCHPESSVSSKPLC